jgi:hypothetical protein
MAFPLGLGVDGCPLCGEELLADATLSCSNPGCPRHGDGGRVLEVKRSGRKVKPGYANKDLNHAATRRS